MTEEVQYTLVPTSDMASDESEDESDASSEEEDGDDARGCCRIGKCFKRFKTKLWNFFRSSFIGYIPNNLYTVDFKFMFILTAMYTSLIVQFRQAANQEADDDVDSGRLFRINSEWTNNSVSGGVSDRILWNCRSDSKTSSYYKTLYLGLIIFYCIVVIVYLFASLTITSMVASAVAKLKVDTKDSQETESKANTTKPFLEVVADEVKITCQVRKKLKNLERKLFKLNRTENEEMLKNKISKLNKCYDKLLRFKQDTHVYNWFTVLYIIPRFETIIMLLILTFTLTSYDIHPIGCVSNIRISYNETEASVTLMISDNSILYKKACILFVVLLAIAWVLLKIFQFSLLPRSKWGLRIEKSTKSRCCCCCCCCPWTITRQRKNKSKNVSTVAN